MKYTQNQLTKFSQFFKDNSQLKLPLKLENYSDPIELYKKGHKIHIKKQNRGKFTEYCGGNVTEACIQKGKNSPDPKIRRRATFAANARTWKHQLGGVIKAIKLVPKGQYLKVLQEFIDKTRISPKNMIDFRRGINRDDRFLQGEFLKQALHKQKVPLHYVGHGMAKQGDSESLAVARMMNKHGYDITRPFYSSSLIGDRTSTAAPGGFYSDGPFIIVRDMRQPEGNISHILINDSYENPYGKKLATSYKSILDQENPEIPHILFSDIINGLYKF